MSLFGRVRGGSSATEHPPGGDGLLDHGEVHDTVAGERGISSVNRAPSLQARISNVLAVGLMAGLGIAFLTWYYGHAVAGRTSAQTAARTASKKNAGEMVLPPLGRVDPPPTAPTSTSVIDRALSY